MVSGSNIKPGAHKTWTPAPEIHHKSPGDPDALFQWQERAFNELDGSGHWLIAAMTGAGKGFAIRALGMAELIENPSMKLIIAVPQLSIAHDFSKSFMVVPRHGPQHWDMRDGIDLCRVVPNQKDDRNGRNGDITARNVERLLSLFSRRSRSVMNRVALCSHTTLSAAFERDPQKFRNVRIVIDEAHHLAHSEGEHIDTHNVLGGVVAKAFRAPSANIKIGLCSATPFRADGQRLISREHLADFTPFEYPFDEFLSNLQHLSSFAYDFATYKDNWKGALKELLKERVGRSIIYIPPANSNHGLGSKWKDRDAVYAAIAGTPDPKTRVKGVITEVKAHRFGRTCWISCIDLVKDNDTYRRRCFKQIDEWHRSDDPPEQFAIIALNTFKEGSNCRWLDSEYVLGPRDSQVSVMQMMGRVFRDAPGKKSVSIFQLLPYNPMVDPEDQRQNLNDYWVGLVGAMMLLDDATPIRIETAKAKREDKRSGRVGGWKAKAYVDKTEEREVFQLATQVVNEEGPGWRAAGVSPTEAIFHKAMKPKLEAISKGEWSKEISLSLFRMISRQAIQANPSRLSGLDYDVVKHGEAFLDFVPSYFESDADETGLTSLRLLAGEEFESWEMHQTWAYVNNISTSHQWFAACRPRGLCSEPSVRFGRSWFEFFNKPDWRGNEFCTLDYCDNPHYGTGYCRGHNEQFKKGQELRPLKVRGQYEFCTLDYCDKPHKSNGYCHGHNHQIRSGQELRPLKVMGQYEFCTLDYCDNPYCANGYCRGHNHQFKKGQELRPLKVMGQYEFCTLDYCDKPHKSNGYCHGHSQQFSRGQELRPLQTRTKKAET